MSAATDSLIGNVNCTSGTQHALLQLGSTNHFVKVNDVHARSSKGKPCRHYEKHGDIAIFGPFCNKMSARPTVQLRTSSVNPDSGCTHLCLCLSRRCLVVSTRFYMFRYILFCYELKLRHPSDCLSPRKRTHRTPH